MGATTECALAYFGLFSLAGGCTTPDITAGFSLGMKTLNHRSTTPQHGQGSCSYAWRCPRRGTMRALRGARERCGAQQTNRGARMAPGCIPSVGFRKSTRALLPMMRRLRVRRSGRRMRQQGTRRTQTARAPPHRARTRCACSTPSDRNNTPHTAPPRSGSPSRRAR